MTAARAEAAAIDEVDAACQFDAALGLMARFEGDSAAERRSLERGLALARSRGRHRALAQLVGQLARSQHAVSEHGAARSAYQESYELARRSGNRGAMGQIQANLGMVEMEQGRLAVARRCLEEALAIACEVDNVLAQALHHEGLSYIAWRQGAVEEVAMEAEADPEEGDRGSWASFSQ